MLNNDDKDVREFARSSLFFDLRRRKVPLGRESEPQFLGFKRKPSGKLDTHSAGFGVWSDWPDLNDLCVRTGVSLEWVRSESESVRVSEDIITDPLTYVRATATYGGDSHPLTSAGTRRTLFDLHQCQHKQHWTGLKLQGKLACLSSADHSVSHSYLKNTALSEDIVIFTVKTRLQVLPTRPFYLVSYSSGPSLFASHYRKDHRNTATYLEWLPCLQGNYIARHDRLVDLIVKDISNHVSPLVKTLYVSVSQ